MKEFMDKDFLLSNDVAKKLYHDYAESMPIYDYHCHLSPRMIYENYQFSNIGELMLGGDHYKWRVMLSNGVDEKYIRGDGVRRLPEILHRQPHVSLDAPGASPRVRHHRYSEREYRRGYLEPRERHAGDRRIPLPRTD